MTKKLFAQAMGKFLMGVLGVGLLIFLPAGTLRFYEGWLLMGVLFVPMFLAGLLLMAKDPDRLRRRLDAREREMTQKRVILLSGLMFLASFLLAGLSFRFGFLRFPRWVSVLGAVLFLLGYGLYALVLKENAYLARTIRVEQGQKLVDTGLYGVVRHPMYAATLLLFLSMPLILGSILSLLVMLAYPILIARRIENEEQVLLRDLPGYGAYRNKVRWRLVPFIW
ncbi:MAG: isoprenylcysteine carboxylmethyltransferase family protein [Clostridia bacterium]|nr:isoprenylcysteine carboxylmethyltransferase family protein [Clostridia bacterium]